MTRAGWALCCLVGVLPGTGASISAQPAAAVADTYWLLAELGGEPAVYTPNPREPHLRITATGGVTGADGCNSFRGTATMTAETLRFGPLSGTLMACLGNDDLDRRVLEALNQTRTWKASAQDLTLFDEKGAAVARFTAANP
jgi:heat shock protein HslJ